MKILDCTTESTMYESLESILGLSKQEIQKFFSDFKSNFHLYENPDDNPKDKLLLEQIKKLIGKSDINYDRTVWFHGTRTNNDFKDGILPLGDIIENIWDDLYKLVQKEISLEKWTEFRRHVENSLDVAGAYHYNQKINSPKEWGPYGLLIREITFIPPEEFSDIGNHDYLKIPEIIEDICIEFEKQYNLQLEERFKNNSSRCIVHFYTFDTKETYIGSALLYLYLCFHDFKMENDCSISFDGKGVKVPSEHILSVELL
ncbi:hypothetical protein PDL07_26885 [Bacillus cereus]|uniref:hypothetical protein n=1 Tax=Bacillus cereus TaxID=1396 RepID=UPI002ABF1AEA|nr:hypothetical protein [Bacillus cereus]MDA1786280.1 hypothetical protein [Bacillus cereus]MDZ4536673.1 hypothetical protein [Bacillus cereus]